MNAPTTFDHADTVNSSESTPLALRPHTILGVCEAIGEDFGISPLWLRVPLAATVLVSPLWSMVGYLALGLVVLASRLIFPNPKTTVSDIQAPASAANNGSDLPLAA
ncbi:MAG: PspC domain-containing protein [Sphingomicrobium sp.]